MPKRKPRMTDLTPAEWVVMKVVWEGVENETEADRQVAFGGMTIGGYGPIT